MSVARATKKRRLSPPEGRANGHHASKPLRTSDYYSSASQWDIEQDYENRPRNAKKNKKSTSRLPIKTQDGDIEQVDDVEIKQESDDDGDDSMLDDDEGEDTRNGANGHVKAEEKPKVFTKQDIAAAKQDMAHIAALISQEPEEHLSGLKTLAEYAQSQNSLIKRLALASQMAIFRDIIPGYRIRPLDEAQLKEKVSKDVKKLREFEARLVSSYHVYVQTLSDCSRAQKDGSRDGPAIATMAIDCACGLLLAVPHFNFRTDLLKIVVRKMSAKRWDENYEKCKNTLEKLFADDEDSNPSLEAVQQITSMIKAKDYKVREDVLNTFLHLRLLSEFSSKASTDRVDRNDDDKPRHIPKKERQHRSAKQKKQAKALKEVQKEFKEADAIVSVEERERMQAETLKLVFTTYFRVLKSRSAPLMGAVLEGLAKFSHLINQDFFGDILEVLRELCDKADAAISGIESDEMLDGDEDEIDASPSSLHQKDPIRASLLCTTTALSLLAGQDMSKTASALSLDLSSFTTSIYRLLPYLSISPDIELSSKSLHLADPHDTSGNASLQAMKVNTRTTSALLLRALSSILTPRHVPPLRIASFTHRILAAALQTPQKTSTAFMALMETVAKQHGKKIAALWDTEERKGDGTFDTWGLDVEGGNPYAGTVWETELLRHHFADDVREQVKSLESILRSQKAK